MQSKASTVEAYIAELPPDRQELISRLRKVILKNLPRGFEECINYGMIGYVVPHTLYPAGYHCDPKLPLPFLALASQKNAVSIYHMGIYADPALMQWFVTEHARVSARKLDMGKSCIRYKKAEDIPFELIGELVSKMKPQDWIAQYEKMLKR